jgi:hypothetical protein
MQAEQAFELHPQKEENIQEARWVEDRDLDAYTHHTYNAIKEVLAVSGKKW